MQEIEYIRQLHCQARQCGEIRVAPESATKRPEHPCLTRLRQQAETMSAIRQDTRQPHTLIVRATGAVIYEYFHVRSHDRKPGNIGTDIVRTAVPRSAAGNLDEICALRTQRPRQDLPGFNSVLPLVFSRPMITGRMSIGQRDSEQKIILLVVSPVPDTISLAVRPSVRPDRARRTAT